VSIVPGVTRVRSHSIRGASEISITFAPRTDMTYALQLVRARVNQASGALPPDVSIEIEQLTPSLFPVLSYNLEGGDAATLYDLARYEIKPLISRSRGRRVDVQGSDVREIEVIVDPARLVAQGMAYADVANAIRQAVTVQAVVGCARLPAILIVTDQEAHAPETSAPWCLATVARTRRGHVQVGTEDHVRSSPVTASGGADHITRQIGGNTVAVADSVERIVAAIARRCRPGCTEAGLRPGRLGPDAVRSVRDAMLIGAGLAWWSCCCSSSRADHGDQRDAIPLTLAITVFVMSLIGQTFNLMTLGAMAIAIGS